MDKLCGVNTIFFDAGGVLFDTKISSTESIRGILKSRGYKDEDIEKALLKGEEFSDIFIKSGNWINNWREEELYWDNYYSAILSEVDRSYTYSFKKQLLHQTHYAVHCKLFDEVRNVLESLFGVYKIGVISNALPSMDWVFDFLNIRKYFDSITISSLVGSCKPDAHIYEFALKSLGVKAEECIFIDDKIKNVKAAEKIGFNGVHLDRERDDLRILGQVLNSNALIGRVI